MGAPALSLSSCAVLGKLRLLWALFTFVCNVRMLICTLRTCFENARLKTGKCCVNGKVLYRSELLFLWYFSTRVFGVDTFHLNFILSTGVPLSRLLQEWYLFRKEENVSTFNPVYKTTICANYLLFWKFSQHKLLNEYLRDLYFSLLRAQALRNTFFF